MTVKPSKLLSGVDVFADRTSLEQQAAEIVGFNTFEHRIRDLYQQVSGLNDAMDLDEYNVLPEWAMPYFPGCIHEMFLEREGFFRLKGMVQVMCPASRFDNRFAAYEYLSRGRRIICVSSSARFWSLLCWDDKPEDIARLKAANKWRIDG